ncbi:hypothetical protein AKJ16_DCAP09774 [Drosera capensis]
MADTIAVAPVIAARKRCLQDGPKRVIKWGSTKLPERSFKYKHDPWQTIVDWTALQEHNT